jgi:hypothetical protein
MRMGLKRTTLIARMKKLGINSYDLAEHALDSVQPGD